MARANPELKTAVRKVQSYGWPDSNTTVTLWDRAYTSSKTPGFPNVKPLPFRAHTVDIRQRVYGELFYERKSGSTVQSRFSGPSSAYGVSQPNKLTHVPDADLFGGSADYRARSKVISDIQRIKVNVAQNIAEYHQVHRMFGDSVRRIANGYRALRHGDVRAFSKSIPLSKRHSASLLSRGPLDIRRHAPSIWLESQYGWAPLVGDVYTGMTDFYKRVESGYPIRAVGRSGITSETSKKWDPDVGGVTFSDVTYIYQRCKYIIEYEVDHTQLANLDDWGITNPGLLAWELLPYSFVVDWFLPVGDWLSQVGYSLGLYFKRGMRSAITQKTTTRSFKALAVTLPVRATASGSDVFITTRWKREVLSSFPSPGMPRFDPMGLRGKRILNALSLLSLAFDRRK